MKFEVTASIESEDGRSDGAYDLCGTLSGPELATLLQSILESPVKTMLTSGEKSVGHVLRLEIRDASASPQEDALQIASQQTARLKAKYPEIARYLEQAQALPHEAIFVVDSLSAPILHKENP